MNTIDTIYHLFHWVGRLDMLQVLLYFILIPLVLGFVVNWLRDFLGLHR